MNLIAFAILAAGIQTPAEPIKTLVRAKPDQKFVVAMTEEQWQKKLTKGAFLVLRKSGTEKPYTGKYWDSHDAGTFECAGCGQKLFSSKAKFDSHTGWPSFFKEIEKGKTLVKDDHSEGSLRTEVVCARCGGHLGHVFEDGPEPTGLRYCMNSPALKFVKAR